MTGINFDSGSCLGCCISLLGTVAGSVLLFTGAALQGPDGASYFRWGVVIFGFTFLAAVGAFLQPKPKGE